MDKTERNPTLVFIQITITFAFFSSPSPAFKSSSEDSSLLLVMLKTFDEESQVTLGVFLSVHLIQDVLLSKI